MNWLTWMFVAALIAETAIRLWLARISNSGHCAALRSGP
jgi:hypothetical protein